MDLIAAEINALAAHARKRLQALGYTPAEIDKALSGRVDDADRLQPTIDGQRVNGAWHYVEALAEIKWSADPAAGLYKAQRHCDLAAATLRGERHTATASANASKPRNIALADAIATLARETGSAKQLWPRLHGLLDAHHEDAAGGLRYEDAAGIERRITFSTFKNRLSRARHNEKSR